MKKTFFAIIATIVLLKEGNTQEIPNVKMPTVLPPSPEAAAITRGGQLSTGLFSGVAQASIPMYDLKMKNFSLPIALNYVSGGLKLDDVPSRVGLGWTLSPSGVVTRIVHGLPDENTTRQQPPSNFIYTDQTNFDYLYTHSNTAPAYETEPDEFRFEAPGLSGKFLIKDNGDILQIPYSNLKIQVTGGPWGGGGPYSQILITNTEGVKYRFGGTGAFENTITHINFNGISGIQNIRTGFFLKEIVLPDGEKYTFNYSGITFTVLTGVSHTFTRPVPNPEALQQCPTNASIKCPTEGTTSGTFSEKLNSVTYQSVYLTSVTTSDFREVDFIYDPRPDGAGDKRVKSVVIQSGSFARSYRLLYLDPADNAVPYAASGNSYNNRFFLKEVFYLTSTDMTIDTLRYKLEYDSPETLPQRLCYAQDEFGYYNGRTDNTTLLPAYADGYTNYYVSANRKPNFNFSKIGLLTKISFPTKGYEQFTYEPNTYGMIQAISTMTSKSVSGSGSTSSGGVAQPVVHYSPTFSILLNQTATLNYSIFQNPGCSTYCTQPPPNTVNYAKIEVEDVTSSTFPYSNFWQDNVSYGSTNVSLTSGHDYRLKITVWGEPNAAWAEIHYDYSNGTPPGTTNTERPGIRVKQIDSYDSLTNKMTTKYYKYASLGNLSLSSGQPIATSSFLSTYMYSKFCGELNCFGCKIVCLFNVINSNSNIPMYLLEGNETGYVSVIESDDTTFANGGIEHTFEYALSGNEQQMMGSGITGLSASCLTTINGYETATNYFNSSLNPVKKTNTYYRVDTAVNNQYPAIVVRRRYEPTQQTPVGGDMFDVFDVVKYTFISNWIKTDSVVTREYDANGLVLKNKTTFYYGSPSNVLPIKTETTDSRGVLTSVETKYPTDFPSTSPYTAMLAMNIISPSVEVKQKKAGNDISLLKTNYNQWWSGTNTAVFEPQTITLKKGSNTEETRLRYNSYDPNGNLLEANKENDMKVSYIWDYNNKFPVAEIMNASVIGDSIAYTSFESDGKGYWQFSGTPITQSFSPTGAFCYNLGNGNITRAIVSSKSYYVTYWLKNSSGSISVNGTSATTLINKNGWTCYRHSISGTSSLTISGSGIIDELRLYPQNAMMKTYTYAPWVGASTECDANNNIRYYGYDDQARLALVRDADWNIVKKICYKIASQTGDCPVDITANGQWSLTGQTRCRPCDGNPVYPSTVFEKQQVDVNPSSPTYNTTRWIVDPTTSCTSAPDWVNTGYVHCQFNSYDENTGYQLIEQRDMNPCSNTFYQTQEVLSYNATACPVCSPACSHPSQKCINGVCTTGVWSVIRVTQIGKNSYTCTYAYCFPDGTYSRNYTSDVASSTPCTITCGSGGSGD